MMLKDEPSSRLDPDSILPDCPCFVEVPDEYRLLCNFSKCVAFADSSAGDYVVCLQLDGKYFEVVCLKGEGELLLSKVSIVNSDFQAGCMTNRPIPETVRLVKLKVKYGMI